ncbi:protein of unknown function [Legionella micdadei]|uniref:Uncharacterized protein n=1 Tax=Legionella micdadei TaxID=451 RepID=A0A098GFB7_LEGMI|nr:protein of unknown function [Legionella micdadei]
MISRFKDMQVNPLSKSIQGDKLSSSIPDKNRKGYFPLKRTSSGLSLGS